MRRFANWFKHRLAQRPGWMNALMLFAAFQVFIYSPYDLLLKPLATDKDVWFGIMLTGWAAKVGGLVHLVVYAIGLYGFWRMRRWVRPWAALYVGQLAFAMFVLERFEDVIATVVAGIEGGDFPANPGEDAFYGPKNCSFCDFQRVCPSTRVDLWEGVRRDDELGRYVDLAEGELP